MATGLKNLDLNDRKLLEVLDMSTAYHTFARRRCELLKETAIQVFDLQVIGPWRRSPTSPPRYRESFVVRRRGRNWLLINTDPGALWVEFGAHAGGVTEVLKYRPLRTAVDILSNQGWS